MTSKKLAAIALALLLSLSAAACGGSKKNDEASNTDTAGQAEKQSDDTSTTTSKPDSSSDGNSSDSSDLSDALDKLNNGELGDCLTTSMAYASLILAPLGFTGGATEDQINEFEQQTQDLEAKIPSELKDDFETVAKAYKEYGDALKDIDFGDLFNSDTQKKMEEASNKLDDSNVKEAQDRIQAYFDDNCGN